MVRAYFILSALGCSTCLASFCVSPYAIINIAQGDLVWDSLVAIICAVVAVVITIDAFLTYGYLRKKKEELTNAPSS